MLDLEVQEFEGAIRIMSKATADGIEEHYSNITEYYNFVIFIFSIQICINFNQLYKNHFYKR